jgi:hypothetical protein
VQGKQYSELRGEAAAFRESAANLIKVMRLTVVGRHMRLNIMAQCNTKVDESKTILTSLLVG